MMPTKDQTWPPTSVTSECIPWDEYAAWYGGDPAALARVYHDPGQAYPVVEHTAQYASGVRGAVARWWWGQPTPPGEQTAKLHCPIAADLCTMSADLLFGTPVRFETGTGQDYVDALTDDGLQSKLAEAAELAAAYAGVFLRCVWNTDLSPRPWLDAVTPDRAVPVWQWGRLQSVCFWTILPSRESGTVWRLLEDHTPGRIEYALWVGTASMLGDRVPLTEHPDTEQLADVVDAESGVATNIDRLTAVWWPNLRPNRRRPGSPYGRSDLEQVCGFMDALDEAYSSWWRDIRVGKGRLIMPSSLLEPRGPGQPGIDPMDREVIVPVGALTEELHVEQVQFAIRVQEHADTCQAWIDRICQSAGYSPSSFGSQDGSAAMTATEIEARERRTYQTRGKKIRYARPVLADAIELLTLVAAANGLPDAEMTDSVQVVFPPAPEQSTLDLAQTAQALRAAEAASVETVVAMVHPDWQDDQVATEAARILSETGVVAPEQVGG